MKKILFVSTILLSSILFFSCDESEEPIVKPDQNDYEIYTEVLSNVRDMNSQVNAAYQDTTSSSGGRIAQDDCLSFSLELVNNGPAVPGFGTEYGKIVLTFDGTTCNDGVARDGSLEIYFKGWGADRKDSVQAINLSQNGYVLNGYSASNNLPGQSTFFAPTDNVRRNISLTFPNSTTYTYISNEEFTYDNIFSAEGEIRWMGTSQLQTPTGYTIFGNIQQDLVATNSCSFFRHIVGGSTRLTNNIDEQGLIIDFGSGACDQAGQVKFDNGETIDYQW